MDISFKDLYTLYQNKKMESNKYYIYIFLYFGIGTCFTSSAKVKINGDNILKNMINAQTENNATPASNLIFTLHTNEINENPDNCAMLNQVQSVVIQLLSSHYENSKGMAALTLATNTIQEDFLKIKNQFREMKEKEQQQLVTVQEGELEHGSNNVENNTNITKSLTESSHFENFAANGNFSKPTVSKLLSNTLNIKQKLTLKKENEHINLKMETNLWEQIENLTKIVQSRDKTVANLERQIKKFRRSLSQSQTKFVVLSKQCTDDTTERLSMKHFLSKQKDVNGQLSNRVLYLEENIKQMAQSDSPNLQSNGCPQGFIRHILSCYRFINESKNWIDAEKHCQGLHIKSHLIGIETPEEEQFIVMYRNYNKVHWTSMYIWTGANDLGKESGWTWVSSGKELEYTNWRPGQPDNHNSEWQHCIYLRTEGHDHRWDDWHCHAASLNFVCEIGLEAK